MVLTSDLDDISNTLWARNVCVCIPVQHKGSNWRSSQPADWLLGCLSVCVRLRDLILVPCSHCDACCHHHGRGLLTGRSICLSPMVLIIALSMSPVAFMALVRCVSSPSTDVASSASSFTWLCFLVPRTCCPRLLQPTSMVFLCLQAMCLRVITHPHVHTFKFASWAACLPGRLPCP